MVYVVSGMLYPAAGWEDNEYDCLGSLTFRKKEDAERAAREAFLTGGYGINGYFEASAPSIVEVDDDSPYIFGDIIEDYSELRS